MLLLYPKDTFRRLFEELPTRTRFHEAIALLGIKALSRVAPQELMEEAVKLLSENLKVEFIKILELSPDKRKLVLKAGKGWHKKHRVGIVSIDNLSESQAGYTLLRNEPVIVEDLHRERRFYGGPFLTEHNIRSGMSVIILGGANPYGVVSVHTKKPRKFDRDDINLLQSVANILALAFERFASEQELSKIASIVDSSDDAIISSTIDGDIISWNRGAEKLYGYSSKEAIGRKLRIIVPRDKLEEYKEIMEVVKMGEGVDHLETVRCRKDGRRIDISVTISPRKNEAGEVIGNSAIARDISVTKELERRKDAFISMASHELKTPITGLKAFNQVLLKKFEGSTDTQTRHFLYKMDLQIDRLSNLVGELLDLSKIQLGKLDLEKSHFDFIDFIKEVVEEFQAATESHQIKTNFNDLETLTVFGDKFRIGQVVSNLLSNAIKYSPDADVVDLTVKSHDNSVVVEVRDYGIGIAKKHQDKVFDRFFRAAGSDEKTFPGLGIGLSVASEIVKRHGGNIWVESTKGKGATFYFALPLK